MNISSRSIPNNIFKNCAQLSCGYIVGPWSVSKRQSLDCSSDADLPFADDTCQDAAFVSLDSGAFGVFDGVGSCAKAREAATWMADYMDRVIDEATCKSGKGLAELVNQANRDLIAVDLTSDYCTTASVVKILSEEPNGFKLAWAHVGDSRIYHVTSAGVQQITDDEVDDRGRLRNVVGDRYADSDCVQQSGEFSVRTGDRVVIVSDGITGNSKDDAMTADELGQYVRSAGGALAAAKLLVAMACKLDDRTVIVIEFTQ